MQIWATSPPLKLVAVATRRGQAGGRPPHDHPFYELGIVLEGHCDWRIGRRQRVSLRAGEAILLRPHTLHHEETPRDKEARLAWIGFDFDGPPPDWTHRPIPTESDFAEIANYFEVIAREHHRPDPPSQTRVGLAIQSVLVLLARRAEETRVSSGPPIPSRVRSGLNPRQVNCVESAAHYFRLNLPNSLSIAQVAAYHSLCPAHFSSLFRRHHRLSPRLFLRRARLERAADLLRTSDLSLKEIAALCGYVDAAHLCKTFKEENGLPPRQFRIHPQAA